MNERLPEVNGRTVGVWPIESGERGAGVLRGAAVTELLRARGADENERALLRGVTDPGVDLTRGTALRGAVA